MDSRSVASTQAGPPVAPGSISMAFLNLRDRQLDTKIAYVGAAGAGKATNLAGLRAALPTTEAGEAGALDVRPSLAEPVDGCPVVARVVTLRGEGDPEAPDVRRTLDDVDAFVFVVDPTPDVLDAAREASAWLRATLAARGTAAPGTPDPVVLVQLNHRAGEAAVPAGDMARELDLPAWPVLEADASRAEDAAQTLETVIASVLSRPREEDVPAAPKPREGTHPLLESLRRALGETIKAELADTEARLAARVTQAAETANEIRRDQDRLLSRVNQELAAMHDELAEGRVALERAEAARMESELRAIKARVDAEKRAETARLEAEKRSETERAQAAKRHEEERAEARRHAAEARTADFKARAADEAARDARSATEIRALAVDLERAQDAMLSILEVLSRDVASLSQRLEAEQAKSRALEGRLTTLVEGAQKASLRLAQSVEASARATTERLDALGERQQNELAALATLVETHGSTATGKLQGLEDELAKRKKTWFG